MSSALFNGTEEYREVLLNTYLSISDSKKGLKDVAYAKAIYLVLYKNNEQLTLDKISKSCASLFKSVSIPENSIESALRFLEIKKFVVLKDKTWILNPAQKAASDKQLEYSKGISQKICLKYFPKSININDLVQWFDEANEKYFSAFADKLIVLYNRKEKLIVDVEKILKPVTQARKLGSFESELLQGYKEFLTSEDREETEKIWNLMQSILSAKIIEADISPDLLNIEKCSDSLVILDTNILFACALEGNARLVNAMGALGDAAGSLKLNFSTTDFTVEEYRKVCKTKRAEFHKLWNLYSFEILKGTGRKDDFFKNLIDLGCKNSDDIDRFFDMIQNPPTKIGTQDIHILKSDNYGNAEYDVKVDEKLTNDVTSVWHEFHTYPKSSAAVIHDVLLIKAISSIIKKQKAFVLTRDFSMETLAIRQINDKENPTWRSIFSLIQILALNGGGPQFGTKGFTSILKVFIEQEEMGKDDNYDERDLLALANLSDRIAELSETKVISLVNKLHKARLSSRTDEALIDVKMELERSLVKKTSELDQHIKEKDSAIKFLEIENRGFKVKNFKDFCVKKWVIFCIKTFISAILSFTFFVLLRNLILDNFKDHSKIWDLLQIIVFIIAPLLPIKGFFDETKKMIEDKRNELKV